MFEKNYSLSSITLPVSWGSVTNTQAMFINCYDINDISLPASWGNMTTVAYMFQACYNLTAIILPDSWGSITTAASMFQVCFKLASVNFPASWGVLANTSYMFATCSELISITLPAELGTSLLNASAMFSFCYNLKTISNFEFLGSSYVQSNLANCLKDCDFVQQSIVNHSLLSDFGLGCSTNNKSKITSVRLTNPASTFVGAFPAIDVSYSDLSVAALNLLFGDLPTLVGKTIKITGCTGQAGCTRTIATAKGWTVTSS
jgi:hypothetical protein